MPPDAAFERALSAVHALGWELVADDTGAGRIEATDTTFWYGFKDDVVVRIRPDGGGSRIDVRSKSRVGRSDVGANAARIRAYAEQPRRRLAQRRGRPCNHGNGAWRSLVARLLWEQEVPSSNLGAPTIHR